MRLEVAQVSKEGRVGCGKVQQVTMTEMECFAFHFVVHLTSSLSTHIYIYSCSDYSYIYIVVSYSFFIFINLYSYYPDFFERILSILFKKKEKRKESNTLRFNSRIPISNKYPPLLSGQPIKTISLTHRFLKYLFGIENGDPDDPQVALIHTPDKSRSPRTKTADQKSFHGRLSSKWQRVVRS